MSNFISDNPVVVVAGAIGAGLLLRKYLHRRAVQADGAAAQAVYQDQNPWQMLTPYSMDAFQYYTVTNNTTRFVYDTGHSTALVSTDMLAQALQTQHDQILSEVGTEITALQGSFDQYISQGGFNPYDVAIAGAANGAQMSFPQPGSGNGNINYG